MNKYLFILIALLLIALGLGLAPSLSRGFTWEGEIDPHNLDRWKVVKQIYSTDPSLMWFAVENPDQGSAIQKVAVGVRIKDTLVTEYRYFKNEEPHIFLYDAEKDRYVEIRIPHKQRIKCMACHGYQGPFPVPEEVTCAAPGAEK